MKHQTVEFNEKVVEALPVPAKGNRVHYFTGAKLQGREVPRGFGVRVTAGGSKAFILNYRSRAKMEPDRKTNEVRYTIGLWPDKKCVAAIKLARELRDRIDRGENPQQDVEASRSPKVTGKTVSDVLDEHVRRYLRRAGLRTAAAVERELERLVKPAIGRLGIYDVRRSHVAEMLDKIEDENGAVMADRVLAYTRKAFNWYATRDDQFVPPIVRGMARTKPSERARARTLDDDEIRDLWAALDTMKEPACLPAVVRTLLLTAQRRGEVADMQWSEIAGDTWTIPAERYKTKKANIVPLSEAVRKVIGTKPDLAGPFVFSTTNGKLAFNGYSKAKVQLDTAIDEVRAKAKREPMAPWVFHDLRRTSRSLMSRAGVDGDVGELVLGHVLGGVRGVYDQHSYAAEKRDALDRLAALIERILNPPTDNVRELPNRGQQRAVAS